MIVMPESLRRILVVDDEQFQLTAISGALKDEHYVIKTATSGMQALDICPDFKPDIIILDVLMPGIDGIDTCKRLRTMPAARDIPILILTGRDDECYIEEAYKAGATDYLLKPINWLIFSERVASALKEYETRCDLAEKQDELDLAQKTARIGTIKIDAITKTIELSSTLREMFGLASESDTVTFDEMLGLVDPEDRAHYKFSVDTSLSDGVPCLVEFSMVKENGEQIIVFQQCEFVDSEDAPYLLGSIQDVTEARRVQDDLEQKRYSDDITTLPNKRYFELQIDHLLQNPSLESLFAVIFVGLDRFSRINDLVGRTGGDEVLQIVAKRLVQYESEGHVVCRYSGDVFSLLITDLSHIDVCNTVLDDILSLIHEEIVIGNESLFLTASIGASVFPLESETSEALMNGAEAAMMQSREDGGSRYTYRTAGMNKKTQYRNALLREMREGLLNNEFINYYQPQLDAKTLKVVGMEALVRWVHPKRGLVSPAEFIPLAEESGLIVGLGEQVLRKACKDTCRWNSMGFNLRVSVNLSAQQFEMDEICELVEHILDEENLEPRFLEVEITESMAVTNYVDTGIKLDRLRKLGIKTSMDDFGTGYSSLSQLQEIPLDTLKVDQAFVRCISLDDEAFGDQRYKNSAIANAIIAMSHSLGLTVIAEGVETEEQCRFLQDKKSDVLQGFLFSKPIPAEEFEKMLLNKTSMTV